MTPAVCPYLVLSLALATPASFCLLLKPLPAAQLRVYYMMSRVNQGSINAKNAAGLTYQTQLLMLNTRPQQQMGQEKRNINEALCVQGCSACMWFVCTGLTGLEIDGCLHVCTGSVHVPCFLD